MSPRSIRLILGAMLLARMTTAYAGPIPVQASREVTLRDGHVVIGQLVELVPGERIVLLLPSGQIRTVGQSDIVSVQEPASAAAPRAATALPAPPAAALPHSLCPKRIPTLVVSDRPIEILAQSDGDRTDPTVVLRAGGKELSRPTCLAAGREFHITGIDVTTEEFRTPEAGALRVDVQAGDRGHNAAGIALLIGGSVVGGAGLFTLFGAAIDYAAYGANRSSVLAAPWIAGGTLLGAGLICIVGGIGLYSQSGTTVRLSPMGIPIAAATRISGFRLSTRGLEF